MPDVAGNASIRSDFVWVHTCPQDLPRAKRLTQLSGEIAVRVVGAADEGAVATHLQAELAVFVSAFRTSGFTGSINWYRNLDRNWHLLADADPIINQPALMIYGDRDVIPKSERLALFVPNVDVVSLDCGHWIQQEKPEETTRVILDWLERQLVLPDGKEEASTSHPSPRTD